MSYTDTKSRKRKVYLSTRRYWTDRLKNKKEGRKKDDKKERRDGAERRKVGKERRRKRGKDERGKEGRKDSLRVVFRRV